MSRKYFRNPGSESVRRIVHFSGTAATAMSYPLRTFVPPTRLPPHVAVLLTSWLALGSGCSTTDDGNPAAPGDTSDTTTSLVSQTATGASSTGSASTGSASTTSPTQATSTNTATTSKSSSVAATTAANTASDPSSASSSSVATGSDLPTSDAESSSTSMLTHSDSTSTSATSAQTTSEQATSSSGEVSEAVDPVTFAQGFDELFMHDECTAPNPDSPDTCLHEQLHEETFVFGGESGTTYDVELRVRGLFEPTNISGGTTPYPEFPYFKVGGTVNAADYSQWHIEVSEPQATYWLNHYPSTGHTIYQEDFIVVISVAAGADVSVRVVDGNNRMIDNGATGLADRQQTIDGVTDGVLDGQVLRLDVQAVTAQ